MFVCTCFVCCLVIWYTTADEGNDECWGVNVEVEKFMEVEEALRAWGTERSKGTG